MLTSSSASHTIEQLDEWSTDSVARFLIDWLCEQNTAILEAEEEGDSIEPEPSGKVRLLFSSFRFMPLLFTIQERRPDAYDEAYLQLVYGEDDMSTALIFDPELTDLALANGESGRHTYW